jgi:hypothetical protein
MSFSCSRANLHPKFMLPLNTIRVVGYLLHLEHELNTCQSTPSLENDLTCWNFEVRVCWLGGGLILLRTRLGECGNALYDACQCNPLSRVIRLSFLCLSVIICGNARKAARLKCSSVILGGGGGWDLILRVFENKYWNHTER